MGQAVLTFLGVVLGAAIAGGVAVWQVRLTIQQEREARQIEREARQIEREQVQRDARNAFQRDALMALHDALAAYRRTTLAAYRQLRELTEAERQRADSELIYVPVTAGYWQMTAARTKIFDDELRELVKAVLDRLDVAINRNVQKAQAEEALAEGKVLMEQIEDRINTLLEQLF